MIAVIVILCIIVLVLWRKYTDLLNKQATFEKDVWTKAHEELDLFRANDLVTAKEFAQQAAQNEFDTWKKEYTEKERANAVKISRAVNRGLISEQFAPYLTGFSYNAKDCKFLGQPIDYVIFDGLDDGLLKSVILLDVKTGVAKLNSRQVQVKKAIDEGRVRFESFRPEMN
jgi:predicted Holliday junction resolvase-like endonuclease